MPSLLDGYDDSRPDASFSMENEAILFCHEVLEKYFGENIFQNCIYYNTLQTFYIEKSG